MHRRIVSTASRAQRAGLPTAGLQVVHSRALRSTRPGEIGPFVAGLGVAVAVYGVKMLLDVANNKDVQEAVRRATTPESPSSSSKRSGKSHTAERRTSPTETGATRSAESYFTTDVMGVDLGHGAKEWSGACAAVVR